MTEEALKQLLAQSEAQYLEYKAAFPAQLGGGRRSSEWDEGRGILLRDVISLANAKAVGVGHVIYGVKDLGTERKVIGIKDAWDDADFQTWLDNSFSPTPRVAFSLVELEGRQVGVFEVHRGPPGPYVAKVRVGTALHPGQVWIRRGTKNTVALRTELEDLFRPQPPLRAARVNSSIVRELIAHWEENGWDVRLVKLSDRDAKLRDGWEPALDHQDGRELHVGDVDGRPELLLMKRQREIE